MSWTFIWVAGAGVILFLLLALWFKRKNPLPGEEGYEEYLAYLKSNEEPQGVNTMVYVVLLMVLVGLVLWIFNLYHLEFVKYFLVS